MRKILALISGFLVLNAIGCSPKTTNNTKWDGSKATPLNLPEVQSYVTQVTERLGGVAKTPERYSVLVVDDIRVNGASLENGKIIVTRGMLNACINEGELAGYIGHQIGLHDLKRENKSRQEIDIYGATLASKAGYDPYALVDLLKRLALLVGKQNTLGARADHLEKYLAKQNYTRKGEMAANRYQRSLASLGSYGNAAIEKRLAAILSELKARKASGKTLSPVEFIQLMSELREIRQQVHRKATKPS